MSLRDKFIIENSDKKAEPYYELEVEMDSNDGDYTQLGTLPQKSTLYLLLYNKTDFRLSDFQLLLRLLLHHRI